MPTPCRRRQPSTGAAGSSSRGAAGALRGSTTSSPDARQRASLHRGHITVARFSPTRNCLATGGPDKSPGSGTRRPACSSVFQGPCRRRSATWRSAIPARCSGRDVQHGWDGDECGNDVRHVASAILPGHVRLRHRASTSVPTASWSPLRVAIASPASSMRTPETLRATLAGHEEAVRTSRWAPTPKRVATGSTDGTVRLLGRSERPRSRAGRGRIRTPWSAVAFGADGPRVRKRDSGSRPEPSLCTERRSAGCL